MDILDQLLADTRDAMNYMNTMNADHAPQQVVAEILTAALTDHERLGAAIRSRAKPWFFAADETMTMFCTEARPGTASSPHDHGTWSVLGCFEGSEESWWHELDTKSGLRHVGSGVLRAGACHSLQADAVHSVMNRWNAPNGVVHIYQGNFLAADRHIWDPVTNERYSAGLTEPLAPAAGTHRTENPPDGDQDKPKIAGTAFAAISVNDLATVTQWMANTFDLQVLTTHEDACSVEDGFSYLIEPASLTIIGFHSTREPQQKDGLDHIALRVSTISQLEQWHRDLTDRGLNPSSITNWNFGTFVEVAGPDALTVRLFVPAVR
jgi:predicted metal-dependent enzyme (double-stranded beta helix superfamily)